MRTVLVAGATGYLGRFLCAEYQRRGWHVRALVREASQGEGLAANACVQAQATMPETLRGKLDGVDLAGDTMTLTIRLTSICWWRRSAQESSGLPISMCLTPTG